MFFKKNKKKISEKEIVEKRLGFFSWIQEFSKKIVVISFCIYILMDIISLAMVILAYINTGDLMFIDTIITEANQTFRDVIGGYILKAATENISKGICEILEKFLIYKDNKNNTDIDSSNSDDEDPEDGFEEDEDLEFISDEIAGNNSSKIVFDH